MTLIKVVYCMRGVLKILRRLPAVVAFTIAFPSHKEFEGFTKHACVSHMVNLVFLFTFNLHWLRMLRLCVSDYYFSPLFPLPCLVDCAPPPLSSTCFTLALTVLHMRASVPADVHPLCTVHARISSPLPYVSLHRLCTLPNPLTCVVPRPLYALLWYKYWTFLSCILQTRLLEQSSSIPLLVR